MDVDGSGTMSFAEFEKSMSDPGMLAWLGSMQVEIHEPHEVWSAFMHETPCATISDMAKNMARVKGEAKQMDLEIMHVELRKQREMLEKLCLDTEVSKGLQTMQMQNMCLQRRHGVHMESRDLEQKDSLLSSLEYWTEI